MDVIMQPSKSIMQLLGNQVKNKNKKYRFNKFCLFLDLERGDKLIMNEMTKSLVRIRPEEFAKVFSDEQIDYLNFLYRNYFLVPEEFDEISLIEEYREKMRSIITDSYLDSVNQFTILTTTKCNARCFYCYELKSKGKHHMTAETAEKVADYIISVADKHKEIKFSWFGGEPLFNLKVIDLIVTKIKDAGFKYSSTIISNGILFSPETINKAKELWHLRSAQITLDGTEEVYNKAKNYIYKDINPYQRVLNSIQSLLDAGISVSIRTNADLYNIENLMLLYKEIAGRFQKYINKGLHVYAHPIFEQDGYSRTTEQRTELFRKMIEAQSLLYKLGLDKPSVKGNVKALHCMVDSGTGVMISPDGNIGLCEHYIDSDFFSHIDNPEKKDWDIIKSWRDYRPAQDICKTCPLYPTCLKMTKCSDEIDCDKAEQEYLIYKEKEGMKIMWKKFRNRSCNKCKIENKAEAKPLSLIDKIKLFVFKRK